MKILLLCCAILGIASATTYENHKVYRIIPEYEHQVDLLMALQDSADYDFWTRAGAKDHPVDIMVSQDQEDFFQDMCQRYGMKTEKFIDDVQSLIEEEKKSVPRTKIENGEMQWDRYYTLEEIWAWMDQLAEQYEGIVSVENSGDTYEGRPIKYLKISFAEDRRAVYIEGGIHAREWISPATTNYIINQILTSTDPFVRKIAESYDWYIVPVANPDGYKYTHTTTRLWRKNRSPNTRCFGTDGNRNWDVYWGTAGTSTNECDETYGGSHPASEAETSNLSNVIRSIGSRLDVFLSFHSYGNMLLMPYGHTTEHLDNYYDVLAIGLSAAEALASKNGTRYAVGNTAETIYSHSGGTMDWVKKSFHVPIAFTYEVRGNPGGFILPPEFILVNCEEVFLSFVTIFNEGDKSGLITLV